MTPPLRSPRPPVRSRCTARIQRAARALARRPAIALAVGLVLCAGLARAQPPPAPSPAPAPPPAAPTTSTSADPAPAAAPPARSQEDRDRANTLMDEGDAHAERGDLAAALTAYQGAHAIMGVPTTGIEVARTLEKLGRLKDALAAAREVANSPPVSGEPRPFADAREQASTLAAALEARVPTLTITVKVAATGARPDITLDGKKLSPADLQAPLALEPGRYKIAASAGDHTPASVEVTLKERDRAQVALALARVVVAPPPLPTRAPPPPPPPTLSPFVPIGFTLAGLGAVVGAVTGAVAISKANTANNLCPAGVCPRESTRTEAQSAYDTADALAIGSDVAFVLAIAGGAMGIYGIAVSIPSSSEPTPANKPPAAVLIGPGSAAFRVSF